MTADGATPDASASRWIHDRQVIAGALHYFRVHPDLWDDRLERLRALGLTAVETYVPWNFHERMPGEIDFSGWRDLGRFIEQAADHGFDVIVRPGPFICAEWDNGGLPAWLGFDGPVTLRSSDPRFTAAVDSWFDALIPVIVPFQADRGGPVIAVQVENEYGSYGSDRDYLAWVRDGLVRRGVTVPLFTADGPTDLMYRAGTLDGVDVGLNFGSRAGEAMDFLQERRPGAPFFAAEFWGGWFDHWGEPHHTRPARDMVAEVRTVVESGGSLCLYMAHGGTTFGLWPGANMDGARYLPTVNSYDSDAPVGEAGELTEKFWLLRDVFARVRGVELPEPPAVPVRQEPRTLPAARVADALSALRRVASEPVTSAGPLPQEAIGQVAGLTLYESDVDVPRERAGELIVTDVRDVAHIYRDGAYVRTVERNTPDAGEPITDLPSRFATTLVVENLGRVNFGAHVGEPKGLLGPVVIAAHGVQRIVHGWSQRAVDLERIDPDELAGAGDTTASGPGVYRIEAGAVDRADAFLELPGWERGYVWLNDTLLGRYRADGPQFTLYAPGPLWRGSGDVITVLELVRPGEVLRVVDAPILGESDVKRDP